MRRRGGSRRQRLGARKERLAEREVEMHRSRGRVPRLRDGAGPERGNVVEHRAGVLRNPHLDEPAHEAPEELDLIDRLRRAGVAELGRTVRGRDDQGHARGGGFDHGGEEVRGGAPGRAHERDGAARGLGEPEGEESGRALVQRHARLDGGAAEGDRERRRARAGADHRLAHAGRMERRDEAVGPRDVERAVGVRADFGAVRLRRRGGGVPGAEGLSHARWHPEFPSS